MPRTRTVEPPASGTLLLVRARSFFVRFLLLISVVQLIELLDAGTPWWPDRTAALAGVLVIACWAVRTGSTQRASWLGDVLVVASFTIIGLGLGRSGAALVSLLAVLSLRTMFGQRRHVTLVAIGIFAGFAVITAAHHGVGEILAPGFVIVVGAASALTVTLRSLGELLADHDLRARLDEVATAAAGRLVAATTSADVDRLETWARQEIHALRDTPSVRRPREAVATVQRRLTADVRLARQRIASEASYRVVAEGNRDGVYLRDAPVPGPDASYTYVNPAAERILGVAAGDLIDDPSRVRSLMAEEDLAEVTAAIDADGLIARPLDVRWRRPDGAWRRIRLEERIIEVDGDRRTVLGMLRDTTQEHEEAEALQRVADRERAAADELRHLDAMKSTFLQAVSHELRTPLSAVIGAAQTLDARDAQLDADQRRRMLEIVQRQSSRLERLLTDLLDVDRLSRGLVTPERRSTSLRDLACGVVAALDAGAASRVEVAGDPAVVAVDGPKVERIIDNLLRNALRHTPPGSRIVCRVAREDGAASIVVEDEGPGVPDELKDDLFRPFSQGPSARHAPSPGTGIGLALVRALAELHAGRAWIEDRPGGGARFVVWLPSHDSAQPPGSVPGTGGPGGRAAEVASA